MSIRTKRNVMAGILVALVAWPLAHWPITSRFDISPWRFFGWAMYSVPAPRHQMTLAETSGGRIDWEQRRSLPRHLVAEGFAFLKLRNVYGELLEPEELAARTLAEFPDMEGVAIRVRKLVLDLDTARIEPHDRVYVYPR